MRVRDHLLLSTTGAALLSPWLRRAALVPWAASILIDVDHYLWFCVHERSASPRQAVRFFNQAQPPQDASTRLLHHPGTQLFLLALVGRWRWGRLLLLGMAFHVALDGYHIVRLDVARQEALRRDNSTCQHCGTHGSTMETHLWRQRWLLPSYRAEHLVTLCSSCHVAAHGPGGEAAGDSLVGSAADDRADHANGRNASVEAPACATLVLSAVPIAVKRGAS